jgi:hypothetical protein
MALHTINNGGTFHLWGHSWEIERLGLWGKFEEILRLLRDMPFTRIDNAALGQHIRERAT